MAENNTINILYLIPFSLFAILLGILLGMFCDMMFQRKKIEKYIPEKENEELEEDEGDEEKGDEE